MLDQDGFLVLPDILSAEQVERFRVRLDALIRQEGEEAGKEVHQERGTERLANLVNKDPMFDLCLTHPRVLAGVAHVLQGSVKLSSLNSRTVLPDQGHQALHVDWAGPPARPGNYRVCNTAWLVDSFTAENGPTRVVPGSHRSGAAIADVIQNPAAPHPDELTLLVPAGAVIIFNSHLWHSGTQNRSPNRRRVIHAYFCRRDERQQTDQRAFIRPETYARLSEAARFLLDV